MKPLFPQFEEQKKKLKQENDDDILKNIEKPIYVKFMEKKELSKDIGKKNESNNDIHNPPIKKQRIPNANKKNNRINKLVTSGDVSDKSIKSASFSYDH